MWECEHCGKRFDEPVLKDEPNHIEEYLTEPYAVYTCPYCGDYCIEEVWIDPWGGDDDEDEVETCRAN